MNKPTANQRNPIKAIRRHCIACCGGSFQAVEECASVECALWAFRSGENPFRTQTTQKSKTPTLKATSALGVHSYDE